MVDLKSKIFVQKRDVLKKNFGIIGEGKFMHCYVSMIRERGEAICEEALAQQSNETKAKFGRNGSGAKHLRAMRKITQTLHSSQLMEQCLGR